MWLADIGLLFRRVRTRVLLLVLVAVPVAVAVAVRLSGEGPSPGSGPRFFDQITNNGVFAALVGLTVTLPFFLPLAVAIVAGDAVAGEANLGTLRYLLSRPVGRTRLLLIKATTVIIEPKKETSLPMNSRRKSRCRLKGVKSTVARCSQPRLRGVTSGVGMKRRHFKYGVS